MFRASLALSLLLPTLAAQRTWIVDALSGPGTHFTDLPPAVAAAAPGDLLLVRTGSYNGFSTSIGIHVVAIGACTIAPTVLGKNVVVTNLPAGQTFTLHGFDGWRRFPFFADLVGNQGLVVLSQVRTLETCGCGPLHQNPPGIVVTDCAQVVLDGVVNYAQPAVLSTRSRTLLTRCLLGSVTPTDPMGDCLYVDGGEVDVVESVLDGNSGSDVNGVPQPAVRLLGGTLRVRGTTGALIQGGFVVNPSFPAPAIRATGGTLVLDPDVALNPSMGQTVALDLLGTQLILRQQAAALVRSPTAGGVLAADLIAQPGAPCALLVGLPRPPLATSLGTLELDLTATLPVAAGSAGANAMLSASVPLPPALGLGQALAFQGVADLGAGIELTSAAIATVR
ncbi:MAG: hypothetical protein R3F56_15555 [Planctomycetota bacterium]